MEDHFERNALDQVPAVLRARWKSFLESGAVLSRLVLREEEQAWADAFLRGPMDRQTFVVQAQQPFESDVHHGLVVANAILPKLAKARAVGMAPWTLPPLPRGADDVTALAFVLGSFGQHFRRAPFRVVLLVLAPSRIAHTGAWTRWVARFVSTLASVRTNVRVLVRDDASAPMYAELARALGRSAQTTEARLRIGARVTAVASATGDPSRFEVALRILTARAMQAVDEGRPDEAEVIAREADVLASRHEAHVFAIPIRFAAGNGFAAVARHDKAIRQFRAAEHLAEQGEKKASPHAARLRLLARFGTGAMLLAVPGAARRAAEWYETTAPLCEKAHEQVLRFDAHRVACLAFELGGDLRSSLECGMRALACADLLTQDERSVAMLTPLADALVRITAAGALASVRGRVRHELAIRAIHPSTSAT